MSAASLCLHRGWLLSAAQRTGRAGGFVQRSSCPGGGPAALFRNASPRFDESRRLSSGGGVGGASEGQLTLREVGRGLRERRYRRVVVMAGAGISTPSGIPDFRSPGSGLYDNLQQYRLPYAEAIFDIDFFRRDPVPFFALARELYPGRHRPNPAHFLVLLLHRKQQLLRMYTQNIDGLERLAGIPPESLVEAHGTFATATCTSCLRKFDGEELRPAVMSGAVPACPVCRGVVKPDIVFFGEELPRHFLRHLTDLPLADLLVVMGTSLEVEPFASLSGGVRRSVPRLLINREAVGPFVWRPRPLDVLQLGDVVGGVQLLADAAGWRTEMDALMEDAKMEGGAKTTPTQPEE